MKMQVVSIRDIRTNSFGVPNYVTHIGAAIRGFSDEINRAADNNMLYKHPEDFEMYHLGEYDDSNADFTPLPGGKKQIAVASDHKTV